jgi:outer membrane protein assembly factor BamA
MMRYSILAASTRTEETCLARPGSCIRPRRLPPSRTREYVIRREFDIAEGDAYNRVLSDRAERRLKNLGYFKAVKITNELGSAADRVVVNVDVEESPNTEFSIHGGYNR